MEVVEVNKEHTERYYLEYITQLLITILYPVHI